MMTSEIFTLDEAKLKALIRISDMLHPCILKLILEKAGKYLPGDRDIKIIILIDFLIFLKLKDLFRKNGILTYHYFP